MKNLVGPPHPFRLMGHPVDLSLRFLAGVAVIVLSIIRFGWLDGMLLTCIVWVMFPHAPRVPVEERISREELMKEIWEKIHNAPSATARTDRDR